VTEFAIDVATAAERATPSAVAGIVKVYTKDVGGVTQAVALMGDGTEIQLTPPTFSPGSVTYAQRQKLITLGPKTTTPVNGVLEPVFPTGRNTITLALGVYAFRASYFWTSGETQTCFAALAFGGTHVSTMVYHLKNTKATTNPVFVSGTTTGLISTQAVTGLPSGNVPKNEWFRIDGIFTVTTAGTFIPQMRWTGIVTQPRILSAGSYCEITPLGAGFTSQGGWT